MKELQKIRKNQKQIDCFVRKLLHLASEQERTCELIAGELQRQAKLLAILGEQIGKRK